MKKLLALVIVCLAVMNAKSQNASVIYKKGSTAAASELKFKRPFLGKSRIVADGKNLRFDSIAKIITPADTFFTYRAQGGKRSLLRTVESDSIILMDMPGLRKSNLNLMQLSQTTLYGEGLSFLNSNLFEKGVKMDKQIKRNLGAQNILAADASSSKNYSKYKSNKTWKTVTGILAPGLIVGGNFAVAGSEGDYVTELLPWVGGGVVCAVLSNVFSKAALKHLNKAVNNFNGAHKKQSKNSVLYQL